MDVQPAHLNRDSFRDYFKGLVALEIIIDLSIGFLISNIISLISHHPKLTILEEKDFFPKNPTKYFLP